MEIAKSFFGSGTNQKTEGYSNCNPEVETLSEDDDDRYLYSDGEGAVLSLRCGSSEASGIYKPCHGGPFSALTPSMWPQDVLAHLAQPEDAKCQPDFRYDEFGFRVEEEDGPEQSSSKLLSIPFVEDRQHRLKWFAHLDFNSMSELTWDKINVPLPRTEKLRSMVRQGVPHSLRPQLWMVLSGAMSKKQSSDISYKEIVKASSNDHLMTSKQIEKDLLRTMPSNACFSHLNSTGISRLRRILRGLAWLYPDIGYCQGTGMIVAPLLLFMEEEDVFWIMCTIEEDLLPASYYSGNLIGVQADQRVLRQLICSYLPDVDLLLKEHDIELSLITLHWFLTVFASVVHMKILLRIWDVFFYEGSVVLFQLTLGMLKIKEPEFKKLENSAQIFNALSDIPGDVEDVEQLFESNQVEDRYNDLSESHLLVAVCRCRTIALPSEQESYSEHRQDAGGLQLLQLHLYFVVVDVSTSLWQQFVKFETLELLATMKIDDRVRRRALHAIEAVSFRLASSVNDVVVETHRRKHLAYLMADQGAIVNPESSSRNLPKQHLNRRQLRRTKSMIQLLLFGDEQDDEDSKSKNVRHTEILVDLREAVLQVSRHFQCIDPKNNKASLIADYTMESHSKDHETFVNVSRTRKRRAKALLDFERHDDDELGFRKNDIITIVSQKDEHCWIGELNGLRGWFPAKFVELLDERSKQYSSAGDDTVTETVTDLVRGVFCPSIKSVLEHGMKRSSIMGGPCHPWLFIEEVASHEVEKDFNSVYSRLVLCKTYRLDEDGKVLTPEEILFRSVQAVNLSHDVAHAQMDVKLRSLICLGLNEQVLHLWLEVLCSCLPIVQKWYHPWSFINSPGWVQIKCELRILSQFAFNLSRDWELPKCHPRDATFRDGVRDMLVKHHLFSWEL